MSEKRNLYRRFALAFATFSIAISIGFFMQTNQANSAAKSTQKIDRKDPQTAKAALSLGHAKSGSEPGILPEVPNDFMHKADLPTTPLIMLVSRDLPVGALPQEEMTPQLGCDTELRAEISAGAMVDLTLLAPCLTGEKVTIHHDALRFTEIVKADGTMSVTVPALAEHAVFAVIFPNGDGKTAHAEVSSLPFYDRAAIVWRDHAGLQLHAREFGAAYDTEGHVWHGKARDVNSAAGGTGGFLVRLGDNSLADAWQAEVYSFPTLTTQKHGNVQLSIEVEVTEANCDREIAAQSLQVRDGGKTMVQDVSISMPDCSAKGEFLVLKNPLEDLKIAQNQ